MSNWCNSIRRRRSNQWAVNSMLYLFLLFADCSTWNERVVWKNDFVLCKIFNIKTMLLYKKKTKKTVVIICLNLDVLKIYRVVKKFKENIISKECFKVLTWPTAFPNFRKPVVTNKMLLWPNFCYSEKEFSTVKYLC